MLTRQQMNDYLLSRVEQDIKDEPTLRDRLFDSYRTWVLAVINNASDQLMSKPTSEQYGESEKGAEGEQGGEEQPPQPQQGAA